MLIKKSATKQGFGDATGPFGFPMPSETCKLIESLLAKVSKEVKEAAQTVIDGQVVNGLVRAMTVDENLRFEPDERADVSMVTTAAVDRDYEVVEPQGIDYQSYLKNPIVGYGHNYKDRYPVGRAAWLQRVSGKNRIETGILAKTMYTKKPEKWGDAPWEPDIVYHFVQEKVLRGKSIGFVPLEGRPPEKKDIDSDASLGKARFMFTKSIMVEYSIVGVQSNPGALLQAVSRAKGSGLLVPEWLSKGWDVDIAPDDEMIEVADTLPSIRGCETEAAVRERVRKSFRSVDVNKLMQEQVGLLRGSV